VDVIVGVSIPVYQDVLRKIRLIRCLGLSWIEFGFFKGFPVSTNLISSLREMMLRLGLRCSVHCPYFINFCSEKSIVRERSLEIVTKCLEVCDFLNCELAVIHAGYYGSYGPSRCFHIIRDNLLKIIEHVSRLGIKCKIAIETMAKDSQFGSLEEVVKLCSDVESRIVVPCIDWAHIYVRYRGYISFRDVLKLVHEKLPWLDSLHSHYTSVNDFEDYHVPVGKGPPDFEEILKALKECQYFRRVVIVCESPLLERDAVKLLKMVREFF